MSQTQTQTEPKLYTFDEFIEWYPESSVVRYELHNGVIVEMPKPTGTHSNVAGFIIGILFIEILRLKLPYSIPKECVVKVENTSYEPDVIVIDKNQVADKEHRWQKESIITLGSSIPLIIEVVSTNWADDYALKMDDYEYLGIQEYWIVDYLGLGGRKFIGNPKQPTVSIYQLVDNLYQITQFRGTDRIISPTFPELNLTVQQIIDSVA
ncbi:MAG: Uma2 family endonuclease [Cyanomargarita calcarea GSE-NOS-MK-12-04C]|jgi:Uma2 family endonuclease|uniref:Uma2 family endonuclease n=1 Tax=Cyanomargarita calcarea GSE-NOS-MK-12-04C TaxID=2839659 RepID=A0A951QJN0_9CYAN|nr:Uma2 family endonuclease [Cyanomargarita calcarea GSE-NOS-MK-12-04C]